jgi:hypothetical protein
MLDPACRSDWRSSPPAEKCAVCIGHTVRSQADMGMKVRCRKRFCASSNRRRGRELRPGVFAHMETLGEIVALTAQNLRRRTFESLADPFAAGCRQPTFALRTPGVRPGIIGTLRRPKEANPPPGCQPINDMPTNQGSLLETVYFAPDGFHSTLLLGRTRRLHPLSADDADRFGRREKLNQCLPGTP